MIGGWLVADLRICGAVKKLICGLVCPKYLLNLGRKFGRVIFEARSNGVKFHG